MQEISKLIMENTGLHGHFLFNSHPLLLLVSMVAAVSAFSAAFLLLYLYWWRPCSLRKALVQQGFTVLPYRLFAGDLPHLKHLERQAQASHLPASPSPHHLLLPHIFPFYNKLVSRYPGSRVVFWWGNLPTILVTKGEDARSILLADVKQLQRPIGVNRIFHRLLGNGLILANGEDWQLQRESLRQAFFLEKLKDMVMDMATSSLDMIQKWKLHANKDGSIVDVEVAQDLKDVAADILARTMFGTSYLKGKSIFERQECLHRLVIKLSVQLAAFPFYQYLPTNENRKLRAMDKKNNEELLEIIELRKSIVAATSAELKSDYPYGTDLLGFMLKSVEEEGKLGKKGSHLSTQQVIDQCKTFFFAGRDTSATLLAWTMVSLALHQEWQEKARLEVLEVCGEHGSPSADNLNKLKVVGMILNETLRLYPSLAEIGRRETFEEVRLDNETVLPRGTGVIIACAFIHRDKEAWGADADEFHPERFANGVSQACKYPYAFLPFGIGPRICIGQHFAFMEAKIILAVILQHFRFSLSPSYCHAPYGTAPLRPKHGVHLLLERLQ